MMKKVLFFIQNFSRAAGSERVTSIIASNLARIGYNVTVLSICGEHSCAFPIDEKVRLTTLINKKEINDKKSFWIILKKLNDFFKRNKVDICIDVFASLAIFTLPLKKIFGFENITWEHFNYYADVGMNRIGRRLSALFSDRIITLTKEDKEAYKNNLNIRGKICYIYNPTPFPNETVNNAIRERLIISVGRLTYQKGFDRLIKVWSLIEQKTDWKLIIIGEGEDREVLQKMVDDRHLKNVFLTGLVKNIDNMYKKASLYVSTARFEGLPMTMIEAQSFGLPIVTFDYKTGPKEIVVDGQNGIIIHKSDEHIMIKKMSEEIIKLTKNMDMIEHMSQMALRKSRQYDIEKIMSKWRRVIEETK